MADPIALDVSLNPCAVCAGARAAHHFAWRVPAYQAECLGCGRACAADSPEEVEALWNDANPPRDVAPEEVHAAAVAQLQPHLTPAFVGTLTQAATTYTASGLPLTLADFLSWCAVQAGQESTVGR